MIRFTPKIKHFMILGIISRNIGFVDISHDMWNNLHYSSVTYSIDVLVMKFRRIRTSFTFALSIHMAAVR
jgi:hypothetical protein